MDFTRFLPSFGASTNGNKLSPLGLEYLFDKCECCRQIFFERRLYLLGWKNETALRSSAGAQFDRVRGNPVYAVCPISRVPCRGIESRRLLWRIEFTMHALNQFLHAACEPHRLVKVFCKHRLFGKAPGIQDQLGITVVGDGPRKRSRPSRSRMACVSGSEKARGPT